MTGRRQAWTWITLSLLTCVLTLVLPTSGWEAATLVAATAILLSLCATQAVVVPNLFPLAGSVTRSANQTTPVPAQLDPDAPGRPRPRAPGRAPRACSA